MTLTQEARRGGPESGLYLFRSSSHSSRSSPRVLLDTTPIHDLWNLIKQPERCAILGSRQTTEKFIRTSEAALVKLVAQGNESYKPGSHDKAPPLVPRKKHPHATPKSRLLRLNLNQQMRPREHPSSTLIRTDTLRDDHDCYHDHYHDRTRAKIQPDNNNAIYVGDSRWCLLSSQDFEGKAIEEP
jgi:hypothetical protein